MRIIDASVSEWLQSLYGPGGSQENTPFFHGKKHLIQPLLDAIMNNDVFLEPQVADELIEYVKEQGGVVLAMNFQDIVDVRMKDIDHMLRTFFEEREMMDNPMVAEFVHHVEGDLVKAWEAEFPEVQEQPKQEVRNPVSAPQTNPPTKARPIDLMTAVKSAENLIPPGNDVNQVANDLLETFISQHHHDPIESARTAMTKFLAQVPNQQLWDAFSKHVMERLYSMWSPSMNQEIGTLKGLGKHAIPSVKMPPSSAVQPTAPKTVQVPELPEPEEEENSAMPFAIRHKHYEDKDF